MQILRAINYKPKVGNPGQALIEAIVALGVITIALMGVMILLNTTLRINETISNNYIGTYVAEEGVELVKNIIDTNVAQCLASKISPCTTWANICAGPCTSGANYEAQFDDAKLFPSSNRLLRFDTTDNTYVYAGSPNLTPFTRNIKITILGANAIQVNSVVTWKTGSVPFQVDIEDRFLNWR